MKQQKTILRCAVIVAIITLCWPVTLAAQQVYAVSADGTIRMLENPACAPADCRWIDLDNNPRSISLAATAEGLFQLHNDGEIWKWRGQPCSGRSCPHWEQLDRNPATRFIAANRSNLFQLHDNGSIWRWRGQACQTASCLSWERLSVDASVTAIVAAAENLFRLHADGSIWRWKGQACRGTSCTSWDRLDRNSATRQIVAAAGELYQRHTNGSVWRWKGRPCLGDSCLSWERLDNNADTKEIVAAPGALYQVHQDGSIWRWKGAACSGDSCPSWEKIDNNRMTTAVAASERFAASDLESPGGKSDFFPVFQIHRNAAVWRWRGQPCSGDSCPHWSEISSGRAFNSYSNTRGGLFVFGGPPYSGSSSAGVLNPSNFGFDMMRFARTSPGQVEMNVLIVMTTYMNTSFGDTQTAAYYENRYFGPERRLENYFNRNSRGLRFRINHVGTLRVRDKRTLACAHRWSGLSFERSDTTVVPVENCPGDRMVFTTATVEHLESLATEQVRDFARFDRNGDNRLTSDELFILKIEGLPDRGPENPFDDNGGLKRPLPRCARLRGTRLQICGDFLPIGDETNFITVAHEFAHLFGALDLYDTGNYRYTLMGATWQQTEFFVHLDPWHRMRMGMVAPKIVLIPSSRSARQELRLTQPGNYNEYEPVLFYDPRRANEYFMVEFRRQRASSYDADVAGSGLVIWHVKTDSRFNPVDPRTFDPSLVVGGNPRAVNILGAPDQKLGSGRPWTNADGVISLNYPGSGDSGLRLEVRPFTADANFLTINWWRN